MINAFVTVWTALSTFLTGLFPSITSLFWDSTGEAGGSLTFIGVMAVVMAGVSLILLVFNLIRSFLPMRG